MNFIMKTPGVPEVAVTVPSGSSAPFTNHYIATNGSRESVRISHYNCRRDCQCLSLTETLTQSVYE